MFNIEYDLASGSRNGNGASRCNHQKMNRAALKDAAGIKLIYLLNGQTQARIDGEYDENLQCVNLLYF